MISLCVYKIYAFIRFTSESSISLHNNISFCWYIRSVTLLMSKKFTIYDVCHWCTAQIPTRKGDNSHLYGVIYELRKFLRLYCKRFNVTQFIVDIFLKFNKMSVYLFPINRIERQRSKKHVPHLRNSPVQKKEIWRMGTKTWRAYVHRRTNTREVSLRSCFSLSQGDTKSVGGFMVLFMVLISRLTFEISKVIESINTKTKKAL